MKTVRFMVASLGLVLLGTACFRGGDGDYKPSRRALELNNRAVKAMNDKQFDQALMLIDDAITLEPKFYQAYVNKAAILGGLDRNDDAVAALEALLALKPDFAGAYIPLGVLLEKTGKTDAAMERYNKALALYRARLEKKPNDAEAARNRALALYLTNDKMGALQALSEVVAKDPTDDVAKTLKTRIESATRQEFIQGAQKSS